MHKKDRIFRSGNCSREYRLAKYSIIQHDAGELWGRNGIVLCDCPRHRSLFDMHRYRLAAERPQRSWKKHRRTQYRLVDKNSA